MKLNNKGYAITIIVFGILIIFVIVLGSLLVTMNNTVKINKVVKEDVIENIQLGADTSGMSLTERIEQLELQMSNIKKETINEIYPVGSIYISTTDDSIDDVIARFGGEWEAYSQGRTLVGVGTGTDKNGNVSTFAINNTGGQYNNTLTTSNLPKHSHSYTPSGTVTSSFAGTAGTTATDGAHNHTGIAYTGSNALGSSTVQAYGNDLGNVATMIGSTGWNSDKIVIRSTSSNHKHSYTPTGTVTSTFTGTASNTGNAGSGSVFSVQDPYITVYMYKRIK